MPNSWFAFKQFTVQQDKCAMKVTSDASLFGAWVAQTLAREGVSPQKILDAGTGTGLLSLMLAQAFPAACITAIDIDDNAAQQAAENFSSSPWTEQLSAVRADVFSYCNKPAFDLVICNPPFFENQLKRNSERENLAAHTAKDWLKQLLEKVLELVVPGGRLAILLPADRIEACRFLWEAAGWKLQTLAMLSAHPDKAPYRGFLILQSTKAFAEPRVERLTMYENKTLSNVAASLLRNYYLHL